MSDLHWYYNKSTNNFPFLQTWVRTTTGERKMNAMHQVTTTGGEIRTRSFGQLWLTIAGLDNATTFLAVGVHESSDFRTHILSTRAEPLEMLPTTTPVNYRISWQLLRDISPPWTVSWIANVTTPK